VGNQEIFLKYPLVYYLSLLSLQDPAVTAGSDLNASAFNDFKISSSRNGFTAIVTNFKVTTAPTKIANLNPYQQMV